VTTETGGPSSRLGEIKERSERGSAWWLDPISDVRWLLEHVEQLQRQLQHRDVESAHAIGEVNDLNGRVSELREQRRAVLDLCDRARANYNPADITPWVDVADVVAALGGG